VSGIQNRNSAYESHGLCAANWKYSVMPGELRSTNPWQQNEGSSPC
jgi:hypothetical protein